MERKPSPPFLSQSGTVEVHQIPVWQDNIVWLLVDPKSRAAAAIDGPEATPILEYCRERGLSLTTIFNTHTHADHIGINLELETLGTLSSQHVIGPGGAKPGVPGLGVVVDEGSKVRFGGVEGRVMLTEGHIDRHVSYVFEDLLFCGDTLFAGGCGYLFDGPPAKMFDSLTRLAALPPETRVCCAHEYTQDNLRFAWSVEPKNEALLERMRKVWALRASGESTLPSTIGEERATNPFLRTDSTEIRESLRRAMPEAPQDEPGQVFAALRALKDRKDYRSQPEPEL